MNSNKKKINKKRISKKRKRKKRFNEHFLKYFSLNFKFCIILKII